MIEKSNTLQQKPIVIDSWAWIEYFRGSEAGKKVDELFKGARLITPSIVIAEIAFKYAKEKVDFAKRFEFIRTYSRVHPLDERLALLAGATNFQRRKKIKDWGIADSIVLSTAHAFGAQVLTGDPHFSDLREAIMLKGL
jgi:predicted nucleic acid-binding protein